MSQMSEGASLTFPSEIWAKFVHFCSLLRDLDDATRAIYSLCLVNRELYLYAVPLLYARPVLQDERRQSSFWATVCTRPQLWGYVRSIVLGRRDWQAGTYDIKRQSDNGNAYGGDRGLPSVRPTPRLASLADALALAHGTSTAFSMQWAEQFNLTAPNISLPTGTGPDPFQLEEVAWWEAGAVGGLLAGHCYSTRPASECCDRAEDHYRKVKMQRARTTEDLDMGRGPCQALHLPWAEARRRHEEAARRQALETVPHLSDRASPSIVSTSDAPSEQPSGLNEDDVWEAAARMAASASLATSSVQSSPAPATIIKQTQSKIESQRSAWNKLMTKKTHSARRVPWRYRLVLGWLDAGLAHFFESIGTLVRIELLLYLGTHLDHDLLEHQLRLILDPLRLPKLRRLDVRIGHDVTSAGNNGRVARAAFARTVRLAVSAIDDPRCQLLSTENDTGGLQGTAPLQNVVDVPRYIKAVWQEDVTTCCETAAMQLPSMRIREPSTSSTLLRRRILKEDDDAFDE